VPEYSYLVVDPAGREKRGQVRADTPELAKEVLAARRLYVVKVEPAADRAEAAGTAPLLSRGLLRRRKLATKQLTLFTRQLATLIQVSPLEEALRTVSRQSEREEVRRILGTVHREVLEGRTLSDAMAREGASFPPLYRAMVSAGETSGTLPGILDRLSDLLERQAQVRGKVLAALAYPVVLSFVAAFVVFALMIYVVPKVVEQFQDVGQELPLLTRVVIGLSNFLANWWWALLAGLLLMVFLFSRALREENLRLGLRSLPAAAAPARAAAARPPRGTAGADSLHHGREPVAAARGAAADHADGAQPGAAQGLGRHCRGGADRRQPVGRAEAGRGVPAFAGVSDSQRRGFGPARHDAGAGGRLSGAGVRHIHGDGLGIAGARNHHHHGRSGGGDRAVHPAPDPATGHFGRRNGRTMKHSLINPPRNGEVAARSADGGGPPLHDQVAAEAGPLHHPSSPRLRRAVPLPVPGRNERGFTLVEMMVVIVIIGLLATVVIINVLPATDRAAQVRVKADLDTLSSALDMYRLENMRYPTTQEGLAALSPNYVRRLPNDPWNSAYVYVRRGRMAHLIASLRSAPTRKRAAATRMPTSRTRIA
jgi:type II secretion system protein G